MQWWCSAVAVCAVAVVASNKRSFVDAAPLSLSLHPNSVHDLQSAFKNSGLRSEGQTIDEEVRELHNLNVKPFNNNLISMQQSNTRLFSDVNGHKQAHVENKQEVSEGGHKIGSLQVVGDAKEGGATPTTRVRGELEVPAQGVHRTFDSADKRKAAAPVRPDPEENMVEGYRSFPAGVQYSPLDMAEYVFWTGDEKGVTMAIEEFLQDGLMTREEAIGFLQEIKVNLEYLQNHYADERFQRQEMAKERANQLQKALNFEAKMAIPSELSEVRQQMRENLSKKSAEVEDAFSPSMSRMAGLTDDDYQELLERLRVADFLYTEYSLEEIIYQLAKVMFSQSLTRGSSEAQEALQKFTGFLEAEAESGRISRSLEKKVLDVLIASLSDTLSERPELVGAARAGLGQDRDSGAATIEKLLMMNKEQQAAAEASKTGLSNHRFQTEKAASDAGVAMKKKSTPSSGRPSP